MAYERMEPWGEGRADLRAGIVASAVFNSQRASGDAPVLQPSEFMPRFGEQEEAKDLTPEEISAQLREAFSRYA